MIVSESRQIRSRFLPVALLCLAALLGGAGAAQAGSYYIDYSTNGTSWTQIDSGIVSNTGGSVSAAGLSVPGVFSLSSFTVSANSNSAYSQSQAFNGSVANLSSTNALTLYLMVGISSYTEPVVPPGALLEQSTISGNVNGIAANGSIGLTGIVNTSNIANVVANSGALTGITATTSSTLVHGFTSYMSPTGSNTVTNSNSQYAINQEVVINLPAGNVNGTQSITFTATTNCILVTTPEPASMTLLGIGLFGMVGYGWRRRRQQQA